MNSAISTLSFSDCEVLADWNSADIDSGELMVIVAAVEIPSHDGRPSVRSIASSCNFLYTAWIRGGAGTGPGRECAALMRDLRAGDSFDIAVDYGECRRMIRGQRDEATVKALRSKAIDLYLYYRRDSLCSRHCGVVTKAPRHSRLLSDLL